jgi:hypothetical protein
VDRRIEAWLLCGAGLLALAAPCGGAGSERAAAAGLELRLEIQDASGIGAQRFAAGESVGLVLAVRNTGDLPRRLEFPTARTHDFAVADAGGSEVWRWSRGRRFAQALTQIELGPGESRRFEAAWDQRDAAGAAAPPGSYHVVASLACAPSPPPVGPLELEISE